MAMNRGGRGWEPPTIKASPITDEQLDEALRNLRPGYVVFEPATAEQRFEHNAMFGDVIDMVEVNGVWMTPEDAIRVGVK